MTMMMKMLNSKDVDSFMQGKFRMIKLIKEDT
jgi:hypothetical protein